MANLDQFVEAPQPTPQFWDQILVVVVVVVVNCYSHPYIVFISCKIMRHICNGESACNVCLLVILLSIVSQCLLCQYMIYMQALRWLTEANRVNLGWVKCNFLNHRYARSKRTIYHRWLITKQHYPIFFFGGFFNFLFQTYACMHGEKNMNVGLYVCIVLFYVMFVMLFGLNQLDLDLLLFSVS